MNVCSRVSAVFEGKKCKKKQKKCCGQVCVIGQKTCGPSERCPSVQQADWKMQNAVSHLSLHFYLATQIFWSSGVLDCTSSSLMFPRVSSKGLSMKQLCLICFSITNMQRQEGCFYFCGQLIPSIGSQCLRWTSECRGKSYPVSLCLFMRKGKKTWNMISWRNIYSTRFTVRK